MFAAGVYDVLSAVGAGVLTYRGHHRSEDVSAVDDEAELFTGVEREADRQQVDFDVDDSPGESFSMRSKL